MVSAKHLHHFFYSRGLIRTNLIRPPIYPLLNNMNITELIRSRRSIFPKSYTNEPIAREVIEELLENANFAPTHKLTEPWRFVVFSGDSKQNLADFMADYYKKSTPEELFSEERYTKQKENPLRASHVIAIVMERNEIALPEFEEISSVAMAVQNMWLTASALGLGAYWSSPPVTSSATFHQFLGLAPQQRCLGLFYVGHHNLEGELPYKRTPISNKVVWR